MSSLNIHQRMAAITAELQTVAKNLNVETGKGKGYKAVSERDEIDAVKPLEAKHGVYSYPASRRVLESAALESENEYNGRVTKKTTFFERIETVYRFVNTDDPTDFIETTTFAEGIDSQDKGSGKAMTYGDKYALMKAYKISTGDDPDQTASEETNYTRKAATLPGKSVFPTPVCTDCRKTIQPTKKRDGELWQPDDIAAYSLRRFDRILCPDCQKAAFKLEKLEEEAKALNHEDAGDRL